MHVKQWLTKLRKSARSKKAPVMSPGFMQVAAVSVIVLLAVGAIIVVAHQATPSASAAPSVKPVATSTSKPVPAKKTNAVPAKPAKGTAAVKTANADSAAVQVPEVVTITGCLEQKDDTFRLKDTGGADAPKSRSWKTGFLTKHSSAVTVVDAGNRLRLGSHVGERVSVTGSLVDKEMQGRSLKALTPGCD